jgi:hypothetical protein
MDIVKAYKEFEKLQHQHKKKKITDEEFKQKINNLTAVSKEGVNWRVDTEGNWYKYDGNRWISGDIKKALTPKINNTFQLFIVLIKSFITNIPKLAIRFLILGLITLIIHTYFVIFPNGGFAPSSSSVFLNNILALGNNVTISTFFWTILTYIITTFLFKLKALGFKKFFSGLVKGPVRALKSLGKKYLSIYSVLTIIVLLINAFILKNKILAITISIGAFFGIVTHKYSLGYITLKLMHSDVSRLLKRKDYEFNDKIYDILQLALISGSLFFAFVPNQPISIYIVTVGFLLLAFSQKLVNLRKTKMASFIIFFLVTFLWFNIIKVFADDGGVAEAGGFSNWIGSPGSGRAVLIGLPPAIGSAIGGIIGILTNTGNFVNIFETSGIGDDMGLLEGIDIDKPGDSSDLDALGDLLDELGKAEPGSEDHVGDDMGLLEGVDIDKPDNSKDLEDLLDYLNNGDTKGEDHVGDDMGLLEGIDIDKPGDSSDLDDLGDLLDELGKAEPGSEDHVGDDMGLLEGVDIDKPDNSSDLEDLLDYLNNADTKGEDHVGDDMGLLEGVDSDNINKIKEEMKKNIDKKDF